MCVWTVRTSVSHSDIVAKSLTSKADYESWRAWDKKEQKETSKCGAFECNNPKTVVLIALSAIRCLCCSYCLRLNMCLFVKSPKVPLSPPKSFRNTVCENFPSVFNRLCCICLFKAPNSAVRLSLCVTTVWLFLFFPLYLFAQLIAHTTVGFQKLGTS